MDANEEYQHLFEEDFAEIRAKTRAIQKIAEQQWDARKAAERRARKLKKSQDLPEDFLAILRAEIRETFGVDALATALKSAQAARQARLTELAPSVIVTPSEKAFWLVRRSSGYTYSTQTQSSAYGRGELLPLQSRMNSLGIATHVVVKKGTFDDFSLWAACEPYQADAVNRTITIKDALTAWNNEVLNARVYMPFLSWDIDQWTPKYGWGA